MMMNEPLHFVGLRGKLSHDAPLAKHTSWRAGGTADTLYIPADRDDLAHFIAQLPAKEPVLAIGLGSNTLVRDGGVRGTVVIMHNPGAVLAVADGLIYADAGLACPKLARFAANHGCAEAEFLAGIPGTIGGALAMNAGVDVVYGQREERAGESRFKRATAAFFYRLMDRLTETPIPVDTGDFRLVSRRVLDVLMAMPERHRFIRGMIAWIGYRQEPIRYRRDARFAGTTKYPLRKMIRFAFDAITAFSVRPLQLASLLGVATGVVSLVLLVFVVVSWLFFNTVHGWASQLAIVTILGSVQLFVLGIIGEYLGRLYEQSKGRPLFVVEAIVRQTDPSPALRAAGAPFAA